MSLECANVTLVGLVLIAHLLALKDFSVPAARYIVSAKIMANVDRSMVLASVLLVIAELTAPRFALKVIMVIRAWSHVSAEKIMCATLLMDVFVNTVTQEKIVTSS